MEEDHQAILLSRPIGKIELKPEDTGTVWCNNHGIHGVCSRCFS